MTGKPEVTTFIGLRYNLVLLIATSKHLMCKCNNVVAIKSAVTPNGANAPYDYCSSFIITVFSVIPQEDFASNATSNRYLEISLIKYEYFNPMSCSIIILQLSPLNSHL